MARKAKINGNDGASLPFEGETQIALFKEKQVRQVFHDSEWYFSITDVIEAVTDSQRPRQYWSDLKRKLAEKEGFREVYDKIVQLKLPSADGKEYVADAASIETVLRIMQSIPSPKAEPFKRWLAKVGFERLQELHNPELSIKRAIVAYQLQGYPDDWINARVKTITSRNELTGEWSKRGVKEGLEYAILTNVISTETFDLGVQQHKEYKSLDKGDNLRDHMTDIELILTMLGEKSTTSIAVARDAQGFGQNKEAAQAGGKVAGTARKHLEAQLQRSVISPQNYLPGNKSPKQLIDGGKIKNDDN